mgnify:CR=1 FL=1
MLIDVIEQTDKWVTNSVKGETSKQIDLTDKCNVYMDLTKW